jgi:hypothetical protein
MQQRILTYLDDDIRSHSRLLGEVDLGFDGGMSRE